MQQADIFDGILDDQMDRENKIMTLDQSLMAVKAKKQSMEQMMLTESRHGGLSTFQIRDASAAGPSAYGLSNELDIKGASNFRNQQVEEFNPEIEPLNFDVELEGDLDLNKDKDVVQQLGLGDFPSLRDLETSNAFTKSNMNMAESQRQAMVQIQKDVIMQSHLQAISKVCQHSAAKKGGRAIAEFSEVVAYQPDAEVGKSSPTTISAPTRLAACSKLMSLMLFAKAGAVELSYKEEEKLGSPTVFKEIMIQMKN